MLGGDLMLGTVHAADGRRQGFPWWNRLASGLEIDLTREQFRDGQRLTDAHVVKRSAARPRQRAGE